MRNLTLLIVGVFTCLLSTNVAAEKAGDYLPHEIGVEWIMDAVITFPDGRQEKATGRRQIVSKVIRDGKTYLRVVTALDTARRIERLCCIARQRRLILVLMRVTLTPSSRWN